MQHRDVAAIARASNYEKHGTTLMGGSFAACVCPKQACGGVHENDERPDCPEHQRTPAQLWHWAAECPGLTRRRGAGGSGSDKPSDPS